MSTGQFDEGNCSIEIPSSKICLGCVKLGKKNQCIREAIKYSCWHLVLAVCHMTRGKLQVLHGPWVSCAKRYNNSIYNTGVPPHTRLRRAM